MKKALIFILGILIFGSLVFVGSCKTDDPEPEGGTWTEEDKQSYDQVINIQNEVGENLDDWFQTMDSLDAIQAAYKAFANNENVSSATINSQGIVVQYANGIRGGLFLNPRDEDSKKSSEPLLNRLQANNSGKLKTTVNNRSMILLNPHYHERSYFTDQIYNISLSNLNRVGIDLSDFYKNEEATVDRFTELADYGIIQIYSHGLAYPSQTNIEKVYLLTGETVNNNTSAKYWSDLTSGNLPILATGSNNKYYVSKDFIANHNDFSLDTIMFFGGFCYSFLGDWPDLADSFARGAYLGFDWSVLTYFNANMSVNSIALMSDTSKSQPMDIESWMNDPDLEKSFWHSIDNRTVHILYAGDSDLTLWDDISVKIIAQSSDGKPVSSPGDVDVAYPFKCEVNSGLSYSEMEFIWDIGTGDPPYNLSNEVNITWSETGNYILKVDVKNKNNGSIMGSAMVNVTISEGDLELIDYLKKCNRIYVGFGPEEAFLWEYEKSGTIGKDPGDLEWEDMRPIVWNGLNFSASIVTQENNTHTITGTFSDDGYTVNAIAEQEGYESGHSFSYTLGVDNYPIEQPFEIYTWLIYSIESNLIQNYVTTFEGRWVWDDGKVLNFTGVNWEEIERLYIGIGYFRVPNASNQFNTKLE